MTDKARPISPLPPDDRCDATCRSLTVTATTSIVRCTMAKGHVERGQRLHQYVDDKVTVRWPHQEET